MESEFLSEAGWSGEIDGLNSCLDDGDDRHSKALYETCMLHLDVRSQEAVHGNVGDLCKSLLKHGCVMGFLKLRAALDSDYVGASSSMFQHYLDSPDASAERRERIGRQLLLYVVLAFTGNLQDFPCLDGTSVATIDVDVDRTGEAGQVGLAVAGTDARVDESQPQPQSQPQSQSDSSILAGHANQRLRLLLFVLGVDGTPCMESWHLPPVLAALLQVNARTAICAISVGIRSIAPARAESSSGSGTNSGTRASGSGTREKLLVTLFRACTTACGDAVDGLSDTSQQSSSESKGGYAADADAWDGGSHADAPRDVFFFYAGDDVLASSVNFAYPVELVVAFADWLSHRLRCSRCAVEAGAISDKILLLATRELSVRSDVRFQAVEGCFRRLELWTAVLVYSSGADAGSVAPQDEPSGFNAAVFRCGLDSLLAVASTNREKRASGSSGPSDQGAEPPVAGRDDDDGDGDEVFRYIATQAMMLQRTRLSGRGDSPTQATQIQIQSGDDGTWAVFKALLAERLLQLARVGFSATSQLVAVHLSSSPAHMTLVAKHTARDPRLHFELLKAVLLTRLVVDTPLRGEHDEDDEDWGCAIIDAETFLYYWHLLLRFEPSGAYAFLIQCERAGLKYPASVLRTCLTLCVDNMRTDSGPADERQGNVIGGDVAALDAIALLLQWSGDIERSVDAGLRYLSVAMEQRFDPTQPVHASVPSATLLSLPHGVHCLQETCRKHSNSCSRSKPNAAADAVAVTDLAEDLWVRVHSEMLALLLEHSQLTGKAP
jgi:hypothetical protein